MEQSPVTIDTISYIPENVRSIFFDNEPKNLLDVKRMHPTIHCVLIDDRIPNKLAINVTEYNKLFAENKYVKQMLMTGITTKMDGFVEPVEGVSVSIHLPALKKWIGDKTDKQLVFDWDRTLSVMEGFALNPTQMNDDSIIRDTALYLMGGQERFEALKTFFETYPTVNVIILTNNPMAEKERETRTFFLKVIKKIIPNFLDGNLLYSGGNIVTWIEDGNDDYVQIQKPNNKGLELQNYYKVKQSSTLSTGGKSNKRKRRQTKRPRRIRINRNTNRSKRIRKRIK